MNMMVSPPKPIILPAVNEKKCLSNRKKEGVLIKNNKTSTRLIKANRE
jgi:aspartate-semialdehyde dehydrogenase